MINNPERLENILRSSVHTGYHAFDAKQMTFEGMFGMVPVEISANIGPLLNVETNDKDILYKEYKQILDILAPSLDILWIQNVRNLVQLQVIMEIAKIYKDDEQIWVNVDSTLLNDGGNELFDFFVKHNPGSIIVTGNDWNDINRNLVLAKGFTEIEGGTKFGVIVDNKKIQRDENLVNKIKLYSGNVNVEKDVNEMDKLWKEQVGEFSGFNEWKDELLNKASKFWIEQGVSIIGCEWESGLNIVKKQADAWNKGNPYDTIDA